MEEQKKEGVISEAAREALCAIQNGADAVKITGRALELANNPKLYGAALNAMRFEGDRTDAKAMMIAAMLKGDAMASRLAMDVHFGQTLVVIELSGRPLTAQEITILGAKLARWCRGEDKVLGMAAPFGTRVSAVHYPRPARAETAVPVIVDLSRLIPEGMSEEDAAAWSDGFLVGLEEARRRGLISQPQGD